MFEERGKHIERTVTEKVYSMFAGYTWFVQMMMNELFALTAHGEWCKTDKIEIARKNVIQTQDSLYREILPTLQPSKNKYCKP